MLHPTFKYMIQLYLPAGFCDCLKSPDCSLEDRATCSISFGPAAGVSDLTHGHMEIPAHRTFVFPTPVGPAGSVHAGAGVVLLFPSLCLWPLCTCPDPRPGDCLLILLDSLSSCSRWQHFKIYLMCFSTVK